jgi:hypothetical protein
VKKMSWCSLIFLTVYGSSEAADLRKRLLAVRRVKRAREAPGLRTGNACAFLLRHRCLIAIYFIITLRSGIGIAVGRRGLERSILG